MEFATGLDAGRGLQQRIQADSRVFGLSNWKDGADKLGWDRQKGDSFRGKIRDLVEHMISLRRHQTSMW